MKVSEEMAQRQNVLDARRNVFVLVADLNMEEAVVVLTSAINECLIPHGYVGNFVYRNLYSSTSEK